MINFSRRLVCGGIAAGAIAVSSRPNAQGVERRIPKTPPVWAGFGLNGGFGQNRFNLTRQFVDRRSPGRLLNDPNAFDFLREPLAKILAQGASDKVTFKSELGFGEGLLLGFAHDYELAIGARLERDGQNANTLLLFMAGVGLILSFDTNTSWRLVSSFPFMFRYERLEPDLSDVSARAVDRLGDAYQGYSRAFLTMLNRFNRWDRGFARNYFARLTLAAVHPDAQKKIAAIGIESRFSADLVGFNASSAICDKLDLPLLPFAENDALANRYAVKFSDDLSAQDKIEVPAADLRFEVIVRDIDKQLIPSRQRGITIIRRQLVINFRVIDSFNPGKPLLQTFASAEPDDDKIPYGSDVDNTPERDLVFFDRLLTRTMNFLLEGIAKRDKDLLAKVDVSLDKIAPVIPVFLERCSKAR